MTFKITPSMIRAINQNIQSSTTPNCSGIFLKVIPIKFIGFIYLEEGDFLERIIH